MYLCHCDLRVVLIFNNRKNKYKKNIRKIFIVTNYKYLAFKIIYLHYVIMEQ